MRKLPLVIIFCLICSLILPPSALGANTEYDHEALMEYEGYGQAIYETLVEETAYITGQYTNNKEYVNKSIDQVKDYAKFWWGEAKELNHASLREVVEAGGGYLLTIGDWFKKMFGGYEAKYHPPIQTPGATIYDFTPYVKNLSVDYTTGHLSPYDVYIYLEFDVLKNFNLSVRNYTGGFSDLNYYAGDRSKLEIRAAPTFSPVGSGKDIKLQAEANILRLNVVALYERPVIYRGGFYPPDDDHGTDIEGKNFLINNVYKDFSINANDVNKVFNGLISYVNMAPNEMTASVPSNEIPTGPSNDDFDRFKKYLDEKLDKIATPQPKPYLVCPNGTKIQMSVSGSTFLNSDGTVTVVNKDGTAQVDNVTCQLGWEKPEVKYIDDRAAIQTPDGKWQDAETGKAIVEKEPEPEKPTEPSNPSCNESDDMEVDSGQCEGVPYFGSKLEFIFGNATGNKNHIERSLAMEMHLNSIGIFDDAKGKKLVLDNLSNAFNDPSSIRETKENGRVVRTSVLKGPNGDLKVESVWDKEKLISVKLGEDVEEEPGEKPDEGKFIKSADEVIFNQSSIDKAFSKHRDDFGNYPDGSKASVELFKKDISELINTGVQKQGIYRNDEGTHIYNETTKQWTFINLDGTMNTAFKLSDVQFKYLIETGVVR